MTDEYDVRTAATYHDVIRGLYQMCELKKYSPVSLLLQCEGDYRWLDRHLDFTLPDPSFHGMFVPR